MNNNDLKSLNKSSDPMELTKRNFIVKYTLLHQEATLWKNIDSVENGRKKS